MRKIILTGIVLQTLATGTIFAQLKAGDNPTSINSSAILETESSSKGILLPRMTSLNRIAITTPADGLTVYDTDTKTIWYWNTSAWSEIKPQSGTDTTNDGWVNSAANNDVRLAYTSAGATRTTGTSFTVKDNGSAGVGILSPDTSALLDINTTNKGVLIPRVNLTSGVMDLDGGGGQATGMLIYNTGSTFNTGFYFWNGTEWRSVIHTSAVPPLIATLDCSSATLYPESYTAGIAYIGTMTIPYTDGNGVAYASGTPIASTGVTGLTATLQSGTLNSGSGNLVYTVTGTPGASSPSAASFTLPATMGTSGCIASVGSASQLTVGQIKTARIPVLASSLFANNVTTPHMTGKNVGNTGTVDERAAYDYVADSIKAKYITFNGLRMDFLESESGNNVRPVLYNTTLNPITYTISTLTTFDIYINGAGTTIAPQYYSFKIDGDDNFGLSNGGTCEYSNSMISFNTGEWYNLIYYCTRDASNVYLFMSAKRLK